MFADGRLEKPPTATTPADGRVMVYDANLMIETAQADTLHARLPAFAARYGGYVVRSSLDQTQIRVEATRFRQALTEVEAMGKVLNRNVAASDVTDQYRDIEIRIANAEAARKRYLELLARAEAVPAALDVEKELERLNGEIDRLKGQQNRLSTLVSLSTITVNTRRVEPPVRLGPLGFVFYGLAKAVGWLFVLPS